MDDLSRWAISLADRVGDDYVVLVAMPLVGRSMENAGENTAVSQSNTDGFA